jgi:hypothetical protein
MSVDRSVGESKIMLDDNTNNDSSSVSANTSNNEESLDSCSNERCVVGNATKKTLPASLIASDDDSDNKSLQVNNPLSLGKVGNKYSEQTKFGSSTSENRPIFSISFRNQDIARLVSVHWVVKLIDIFTNDQLTVEDCNLAQLWRILLKLLRGIKFFTHSPLHHSSPPLFNYKLQVLCNVDVIIDYFGYA